MMPATPSGTPSSSKLNVIFKGGGWLRGFFVVSFGATTAMAFMAATFRVLQSQPAEAFSLLHSWGPAFIIGTVAIYLFYVLASKVTSQFLRILEGFFDRTAKAQENSATALTDLAVGVKQIAAKDDRAFEEMQTLTAFTGQQSERMRDSLLDLHDKVDRYDKRSDEMFRQILNEVRNKP